jgi:hypothetical protein
MLLLRRDRPKNEKTGRTARSFESHSTRYWQFWIELSAAVMPRSEKV